MPTRNHDLMLEPAAARLTAMKEERDGLSSGPMDPDYDDDFDGCSPAEEGPRQSQPSYASAHSSKQTLEVPLSGGNVNDGYRCVSTASSESLAWTENWLSPGSDLRCMRL